MVFNGRIGHLEGIESPFSNAGGVAKSVEDVAALSLTGVGLIEDGSHTLETDRKGNAFNPETGQFDRTVYYHDPETGLTYNSLGMPGKGMDDVEATAAERISLAHGHGKKYVLNVAPITHDPVSEVRELVARGYEMGADAVIVNGGCPNVEGQNSQSHERLSTNAQASRLVLEGLTSIVDSYKPVWYRVSPMQEFADLKAIAQGVISSGVVSAILVPNTWPVDIPRDGNGEKIIEVPMAQCGMSGPGTLNRVLAQTKWWSHALKGTERKIDVVASGGVTNATALRQAFKFGAVAAAGTTFFYESKNGWADDVHKLLSDFAQQS